MDRTTTEKSRDTKQNGNNKNITTTAAAASNRPVKDGPPPEIASARSSVLVPTPSTPTKKKPNVVEHTTTSVLKSAKVFECFAPPPLNSIRGTLVPKAISHRRHRRKVSVELHLVSVMEDKKAVASYEECIVRVLDPVDRAAKREALKRAQERRQTLRSQYGFDTVEPTEHFKGDDGVEVDLDIADEDDVSHNTGAHPHLVGNAYASYQSPDFEEGWKVRYRIPARAITIRGTNKSTVTIEIGLWTSNKSHKNNRVKSSSQIRDLVFDGQHDALEFVKIMRRELEKEKLRNDTKLEATIGHVAPGGLLDEDATVSFLIEIVSAWGIPAGDFFSSDPFVVCYINDKEVHRTKHLSKTLDPIWTLHTGSLFIHTISVAELLVGEGLICVLKDFDTLGSDETLGMIVVSPKVIYESTGERLEYKLQPSQEGAGDKEIPGHMAIRCRRATESDKQFLEAFHKSTEMINEATTMIMDSVDNARGGAVGLKSLLTRKTRVPTSGPNKGKKEYKVKPHPDKDRVEETMWMTEEQIHAEALKESTLWVDAGAGKLGRVYVEILGCDSLPNLDVGGFAGNKTDAFVSLVYEDVAVQSDIIDDSLSPRWMPWSRRAFILHMMHPSSQLFLGVFDFDPGLLNDHDLIGRVSVDLTNLRKDTVYTLKYFLCTTAKASQSDRKQRGSVTIRLRLEIDDERQPLLTTLEPPPHHYVNTKKKRDHRVITKTIVGKHNMERYSLHTINAYIEELYALQNVAFYIQDATTALFLWRNTNTVKIMGKSFDVPLHSVTAFLTAVILVEEPQYVPSFICFSIAWLMLASMDYQRQLPDVWMRCKSYRELFSALVLGDSRVGPDKIASNQNRDETVAFNEQWQKRLADAEAAAQKAYEESVKKEEERLRELEEIGEVDTDLAKSKEGGLGIDPFKPLLFPIQQQLETICLYSRLATHVVTWQESTIAFWLTTAAIALSFVFLFVPWFFLMAWTVRIVVWTAFGPWMKLVDIYYVRASNPKTDADQERAKDLEAAKRRLEINVAVAANRIKRENAAKLLSMKKYLFGKFITRVPVLKEDRYRDIPLPESSAEPYEYKELSMSEIAMKDAGYNRVRVPGQYLVGDMIPQMEDPGRLTDAPVGQAVSRVAEVDMASPGGAVKAGPNDSATAAYVKIGSVLVTASVITWIGVPILSGVVEEVLNMM